MSLNPYIAGNPVQGDGKFIGRIDVIREVKRILKNPSTNAIVLYGQRRIGKTSILLQLESSLSVDEDYTPIYFDLAEKSSRPLNELLYEIAQKVTLVTKVSHGKKTDYDSQGVFFKNEFMPNTIQKSQNKGLVFLFDEFDVLDTPHQDQKAGKSFFPYLVNWMKDVDGAQFVFVLGRRPEDLSTATLEAFKAIRSERISLMAKEDSESIIKQSEDAGGLNWVDKAVRRVWYWTQGHPTLPSFCAAKSGNQRGTPLQKTLL